MNKFKFQPPQENRRQLQQKCYDVAAVNNLEKCTQIIREDRLFLRNQLMKGCPQLTELFRKYPKLSQLHDLQVRLRKFLNAEKLRLRNENIGKLPDGKISSGAATQQKLDSKSNAFMSTYKSPSRRHNSDFERKTSTKRASSQDHTQNKLVSNATSLKHFQQLLKLKYNQEVIQERQSQNVTSARQRRSQIQKPNYRAKPLKQHNYNKIKGGRQMSKSFFPIKSESKMSKCLQREDKTSWQFHKRAEQILYKPKPNEVKQIEQIQKSLFRPEKDEKYLEEESIYDKHFNQSYNSIILHEPDSNKELCKDQARQSKQDNQQYETQSCRKSQENLFTPLNLLNQCRNFIKSREKSALKFNYLPLAQELANHRISTIQSLSCAMKADVDRDSCKKDIKQRNIASTLQPVPKIYGLPKSFSIQDFVKNLMEITNMEPFISSHSLSAFLMKHPCKSVLSIILGEEMKKETSCLTTLAERVNIYYNSSVGAAYLHKDSQIISVYNLLDIDQKGFVTQLDIRAFLQQIEAAAIQDYQSLASQLWRLFHGIDFKGEHRISYWNFFLTKNTSQFQAFKTILDRFDFEIDRS